MFRHCVAGIDFSAGWDQVQAQLKRMTSLLGIQQLTLVHVDEPRQWTHRDFTDAASGVRLEQVARDVQAGLGIEVHSRLASGFAATAILEVATRQQADLIVVANRSHSRGRDLIMGNVALNLVRLSTPPLLVVPFDMGATNESAPLLLVTDNSPLSSGARTCFAGLLGARKGRVMLIQRPDQQPTLSEMEALNALAASHVDVTIDSVAGDPVAEVCRVAREIEAPLIIFGMRAGTIGQQYHDSLLEDLCRQTLSPVLLIPS
jgi:nucleotide-binding universal stress UspA family protein